MNAFGVHIARFYCFSWVRRGEIGVAISLWSSGLFGSALSLWYWFLRFDMFPVALTSFSFPASVRWALYLALYLAPPLWLIMARSRHVAGLAAFAASLPPLCHRPPPHRQRTRPSGILPQHKIEKTKTGNKGRRQNDLQVAQPLTSTPTRRKTIRTDGAERWRSKGPKRERERSFGSE